jgi:GNAT superfamily N-acetyltransferase
MMMLAVDGPRIVGAMTLHRHTTAGMYSVVEPMNVHPDYQRHGVGTQLWTAMAAQAKRVGDRGMQVWALDGNAIAVNFYTKRLRLPVVGTGDWWLGNHREPATGFQLDFGQQP